MAVRKYSEITYLLEASYLEYILKKLPQIQSRRQHNYKVDKLPEERFNKENINNI